MADWTEQYLSALDVRDTIEKAEVELYVSYTHLADRTARLSQTHFITQEVEVWSDALRRGLPTTARLDAGLTGEVANLISESFLDQLGLSAKAPTDKNILESLGDNTQIRGVVELKVLPVNRDQQVQKRIDAPMRLTFHVHNRSDLFGDMLIGRQYCQDLEAIPISPPPPLLGRRNTKPTSPAPPDSTHLVTLRADLAKAQSERSDLQSKLDTALRELDTLKAKSKADARRLAQLSASVSQLTIRFRDRDEELRGKAKLIEDVQDENVTLNLQLNMADEHAKKLKKENQELVDRWMARMGKEAERMNDESKFG